MTPRYVGVCGEERAAFEPRVGCGTRFDLGPAGLTVARWFDGVPGWRLLGCCPVCAHLVVDVPLRVPACEVWRRAGARVAVFARPAEFDDPVRARTCPPHPPGELLDEVIDAVFWYVTCKSLDSEVAEMTKEER